jgi:hypothetical protein
MKVVITFLIMNCESVPASLVSVEGYDSTKYFTVWHVIRLILIIYIKYIIRDRYPVFKIILT